VLALVWAAALLAAGQRVPSTHSDLPWAAAALLGSYPAIDAIASFVQASFVTPASARLLRVNGTISTAAVAAVAVTAFGYEAGSALAAFGVWAAVSGSIQLGTAIRQRRPGSRQLPMIISGGLSTVAGAGFIAASGMPAAHLGNVAGYMALGAVFYLLWAYRSRTIATTGR
jgi:uncharacterized membrane protein HdeD (DUF308 family)